MAIVPLLHEASRTETKLAELTRTILASSHQATVIEPLMILDPHHQILRLSLSVDLDGLSVPEDQGLHGADMLVVVERLHYYVEVQRVRHRRDHDLTRRHTPNHFAVELRL